MNLHSLLRALVGDCEFEDDLLVVVGIDDLSELVGEGQSVQLGGRGLKLKFE